MQGGKENRTYDASIHPYVEIHVVIPSFVFSNLLFSFPDSNGTPTLSQIMVASSVGIVIAAAVHYRLKNLGNQKFSPVLLLGDSGRVLKLEKFSHYVGKIDSETSRER